MSVNTKMTALADQVRTLSGGTGALGIDAMTSAVRGGNEEIGSQTNLIADIQAALVGKAAPGGSSGAWVFHMEDGSVADLSAVSEIAFNPGGFVSKITDGSGAVLWEANNDGLPSGWSLASYVQFTGAQTVDTGIVPTQDTRIEATFTKEGTTAMYLYGVRNASNTASVTAYLNANGAWRFGNVYKNLTLSANKEYSTVQDKNGVILNGTNNAYDTVSNFTANGTMTIGSSRGTDGSLGTSQFVGPVKEFRMYSGDTLVLELLPVYNATEGIYAFYDSVSGELKQSITDTALQGG